MNYDDVKNIPRILLQTHLKPIQGQRFQPTGFPDLGAATFINPADGTSSLLVESVQSMANRLEAVCMNDSGVLADSLDGIPFVEVKDNNGKMLTNSMLEAHRLGSAYILEGKENLIGDIQNAIGITKDSKELSLEMRSKLHKFLLKTDPNSLLHGIFFAKEDLAGGRLRIPRALSAFIEATKTNEVLSGGAKIDHVNPSKDEKGGAEKGFGNIPFPRMEYSAEKITAYFNLDVSQIINYDINKECKMFLILLALWKIRRFVDIGLRLRTACDLVQDGELEVTSPKISIPSMEELDKMVKEHIKKCANQFDKVRVRTITYIPKKSKNK